MKDFNTSLLREKFTIRDAPSDAKRGRESPPVVAVSNRIVLPLANHLGNVGETLVIRAQTMHGCLRMAARVIQEFQDSGPVTSRPMPLDWKYLWMSVNKGYEEKFNPDRWVAVYHKGRVIYEDGQARRHPFLDIIEQCDTRNQDSYEHAVAVAEDAFKQAGRQVTIGHDSNVALVLNADPGEVRCGVIVRSSSRTMTFSFTARPKAGHAPRIAQCLGASASFLEGIHLAHQIGIIRQKQLYNMIDPASGESEKAHEAMEKLESLNDAIRQFENLASVSYRPERPDFSQMIESAQASARQDLENSR
jgi:hypothetical protein